VKYEPWIAFKHLTRRRKTGFISLISLISILGVAVGVMALIVVLAVMSGFDRELKTKIVNVHPHLRIEKVMGIDQPEILLAKIHSWNQPGIETVSGFIEGQAILRSETNAVGVVVKGVDRLREDLTIFGASIRWGRLGFDPAEEIQIKKSFFGLRKRAVTREVPPVILGETLARILGVGPGDSVSLIAPFAEEGKVFSLTQAESRTFRVEGIFRMGMSDFDSGLVLVSLEEAQRLYHLGRRVTGLSVRFRDVDLAEKVKGIFQSELGADFLVRSWYDMNRNFFNALQVEKNVMTILLALIILVAAFNIVSTLIMVVMEKTKDIGILRALGATRRSIRRIFVLEGFSYGFFGVVLGSILGLLLAANLNPVADFVEETTGFAVFPSDIYYFDRIPTEINPSDVVTIVILALLTSVLAGIYPAHRAASLNPVEALRYE
jgi:lipoprotein-releasing system permease protein